MERYIRKGNKKLRYGYTTGSCAAAAAKAAALMLLGGEAVYSVDLSTPKGWTLRLDICDIKRDSRSVSCAVRKDSGDDPDITDGIMIYARAVRQESGISISGGRGIGIVTQKGLRIPVGGPAINETPRQMIIQAVREAMGISGYSNGVHIEIYAPEGEAAAKKTFNQRLGIEGGISILGTTGIVEPMSETALLESLRIEMDVQHEKYPERILFCPGNYGWAFADKTLGLDMRFAVKISNFVGDMLDHAMNRGYKRLLLVAHIGKAVKIAGGIMNTHSKFADCRAEIMAAHVLKCGASGDIARSILDCVSTDAMVEVIKTHGMLDCVTKGIALDIEDHMAKRVFDEIKTGVVLFSHEHGLLGMGNAARDMIEDFKT